PAQQPTAPGRDGLGPGGAAAPADGGQRLAGRGDVGSRGGGRARRSPVEGGQQGRRARPVDQAAGQRSRLRSELGRAEEAQRLALSSAVPGLVAPGTSFTVAGPASVGTANVTSSRPRNCAGPSSRASSPRRRIHATD